MVQVADGGPAAAAGFLQGDILVRLDGSASPTPTICRACLARTASAPHVTATVVRGGELKDVNVTVGTRE